MPAKSNKKASPSTPSPKKKNAKATSQDPKKKNKTKRKKAHSPKFGIFIRRLVSSRFGKKKNGSSAFGFSQGAMNVLNCFIRDVADRIGVESKRLAEYEGMRTIKIGAISSAVKLHFPTDLANQALNQGVATVNTFTKDNKDPKKSGSKKPRK